MRRTKRHTWGLVHTPLNDSYQDGDKAFGYLPITFYTQSHVIHAGGEKQTPEIPKERIASVLKPDALKLEIGGMVHFIIKGPHREGVNQLYSLPVHYEHDSTEGDDSFPLNTTHTRMLVSKLGSNSDTWIGSEFDAVVIPQRNPQANTQVKGWSILEKSITPKRSKVK